MTEESDQTPERPLGDGPQDEKSPSSGTSAGCGVALLGIIIPFVMMGLPSITPCSGECMTGWFGVNFLFFGTPIFVILGLAIALGSRRNSESEDAEPGASDSSN
jgi:hypothetical protein